MGDKGKKVKAPKVKVPSGGIRGFFQRLWNLLVVSWIGMCMNLKEILTFHKKFDLQKVPRRPGEVAVVTGGGRGIGIEIVKKLLILDMHVVIGCRNHSAGNEAVEKLRKGGIATGTVNILSLDLTSLESVRDFANKVLIKYPKIHVLINNGGIMFPSYSITMDGNESQFQVNYLSHFLLTNLLLPKLVRGGRAGKTSRIVNVSSVAHRGGRINFEDINQTKMYCKTMGYMASKLMQVVSTKDLNGRLVKEGAHVRVYAVHPGVVKTDLYEHVTFFKVLSSILRFFYKSPEQGADGVVFAAISSKFEGEGGHYFANCKRDWINRLAKRDDVQKSLWHISCQLTDWNDISVGDVVKQAMITGRGGGQGHIKRPAPTPGGGGGDASIYPVLKENHVQKIQRQPRIEVDEGASNVSVSKVTTTSIQNEISQKSPAPKISVASAPSSQKSSISSTNTMIGTDQISVVIIPATATEISSSESDGDNISLPRSGGNYEESSTNPQGKGQDDDHEEKVTITEVTSEEGINLK